MVTQIRRSRPVTVIPRQAAEDRANMQKRQPKLPFSGFRRSASGCGLLARVALAELLDPSGRVDDLLLACVEGMASRAHLDVKRLVDRGARRKRVAAAARHLDFAILRMNTGFHRSPVPLDRASEDGSGVDQISIYSITYILAAGTAADYAPLRAALQQRQPITMWGCGAVDTTTSVRAVNATSTAATRRGRSRCAVRCRDGASRAASNRRTRRCSWSA